MYQQIQQQNSTESYAGGLGNGGGSAMSFPELPQLLPWTQSFNQTHEYDPFVIPSQLPSSYGGLFNWRPSSLQYGLEGPATEPHLRLISDRFGQFVHPGSDPFGLHAELQKLTAREIMDAKALAASKAHSEAERKRRERINNHLSKLRSLLPSTTKTDKASLLAEVIQHLKDLKRQTSLISETSQVPTETNELTVDNASGEEGKLLIKASICCEDRADLLSDLIRALKSLRLRALKAETTALGGRVKNVLFLTEDEDSSNGDDHEEHSISSVQEALKAVMEKSGGDEPGSGCVKRQRTNNVDILDRSL